MNDSGLEFRQKQNLEGLLQDQTKALVLPAKLFVKSFFFQACKFLSISKRQRMLQIRKALLAMRMPRIGASDVLFPVNGNG